MITNEQATHLKSLGYFLKGRSLEALLECLPEKCGKSVMGKCFINNIDDTWLVGYTNNICICGSSLQSILVQLLIEIARNRYECQFPSRRFN